MIIHDVPWDTKSALLQRASYRCELTIFCQGTMVRTREFCFVSVETTNDLEEIYVSCRKCVRHLNAVEKINTPKVKKPKPPKPPREKFWSLKFKIQACKNCGLNEREHAQDGLCTRCFARQRNKNKQVVNRTKKLQYLHNLWQ